MITVWMLIVMTSSGYRLGVGNQLTLTQFADLRSCEAVQKSWPLTSSRMVTMQCVEVRVPR